MSSRAAAVRKAVRDPEYHRRALMKMPLFSPQVEAVNLIEKHLLERSGKIVPIRSARQTMKNEVSATVQLRCFHRFRSVGGNYIRTAPTYKPQVVNSKRRLEKMLRADPLIKKWDTKEGYIYEVGNVSVTFLSSGPMANVVGDTADIGLDIDEAHKVDAGKFEEDFAPMTAWAGCPSFMFGVAADKSDLLYHYLQLAKENGGDYLEFPAEVWIEINPNYRRHYEERVRTLGEDHPVILTQYRLIDIDPVGGYLRPHQIASLLDSDHNRTPAPVDPPLGTIPEYYYLVTIDIGGEAEEEIEDPYEQSEGGRDSTFALIWQVDLGDMRNEFPKCRLMDAYQWTGKQYQADEGSPWLGQQETLLAILNMWKPKRTVVDSRGIGHQVAKYLSKRYEGVMEYSATTESVSEDCYGLLALLNNDRVKFWRNDDSEEYRELVKQARHTGYEIALHERMRIVKPQGGGHIDGIKAATYLARGLETIKQIGGFAIVGGHDVTAI
jgi:hypothetical protein